MAQALLDTFQTQAGGDFNVSASPGSQTVTQGGSATYTITVQSSNCFNSPVDLHILAGAFPGASLNPSPVTPPANGSTTSTLTLSTNPSTPTGTYTIYVVGVSGNIGAQGQKNASVSITVNSGCTSPTIITQPGNPTITSGTTATLNVGASGSSPLSYQWYRGTSGDTSSPIGGATSSSFTTSPLNSTANYWVQVSNACGRVNSNTATVTIACTLACNATVPPSGTAGTSIPFSATATPSGCTGSQSYDWEFGDGSAHASQQNPTHTYTAKGTYTWRVIATMAGSPFCQQSGTITINTGCTTPTITTQPSSKTIASGQTASLSVVGSGTPILSYQWYRGSSGDTSTPINGAISSNFTTPSLSNTTSYWVRVSNSCGSVNSSTATVTVNPSANPPHITDVNSKIIPRAVSSTLTVDGSGFQQGFRSQVKVGSSVFNLPPGAQNTFINSSRVQVIVQIETSPNGPDVPFSLSIINPDNQVSNEFTGLKAQGIPLKADLTITKTASPNPVPAGSNITYKITVKNNGPDTATNVSLTDPVIANATFQSNPALGGWSCMNPAVGGVGIITCTKASMAAAETATFTVMVKVNQNTQDGTVISNTAAVSSPTFDPNTANNSATAKASVSNPPPTISLVSPMLGIQGATITNLTITGTNFQPTSTLSFSGTGITINSYGPRTANQLIASITIATNAPTGARDVVVTNPGGQKAKRSAGFTVSSPSLSGTIGIGDGQTLWPLDGDTIQLQVTATASNSGAPIEAVVIKPNYRFDKLAPGEYILTVTLKYRDRITIDNLATCNEFLNEGCRNQVLLKTTTLKTQSITLPRVTPYDIKFPIPLVMVHGILSCFEKWYAYQDNPDAKNFWDNYVRGRGLISFTPNYHYMVGPDHQWVDVASEVQNQIEENFKTLSHQISSNAYPSWVYIGHSQGGLVARVLTSGPNGRSALVHSLQKLFLLGTPNSGGRPGAVLVCAPLLGVDPMETDFNNRFPNFNQKSVTVYAGTYGCPPGFSPSVCPRNTATHDGVVNVDSVHNIYQRQCTGGRCQPHTLSLHLDGEDLFYSHTELGAPTSRLEILTNRILPRILSPTQ